jgi:IS30 family transposase
MAKYSRLNMLEREELSRQLAAGYSLRKISKSINRSPSTLSREILRNVPNKKYYRAHYGQGHSNVQRHKRRKNRKLEQNFQLRKIVNHYLRDKWSPEQIAKRLIILYPDDMSMRVSHETIYSYIYVKPQGTFRRRLISYLRRKHKHRRKKGRTNENRGPIQDYVSIEDRPAEVADRVVPGHWEGDLIVGARNASAIGTLVERKTRMTFIVKLANQDSATVRKAFAEEFKHLPKGLKKTLTYDQGHEMAQHKIFVKDTDITVYFTHPRSPWERGSNENTNSLIRQYFPQGTDFSKISKNRLKKVQDELNDRPRKTLGWYTPHEKFHEVLR